MCEFCSVRFTRMLAVFPFFRDFEDRLLGSRLLLVLRVDRLLRLLARLFGILLRLLLLLVRWVRVSLALLGLVCGRGVTTTTVVLVALEGRGMSGVCLVFLLFGTDLDRACIRMDK